MTHRLNGLAGSDTPTPLPDGLQFMQLLWAVVHGVEKTSKRMSAELGVTGPQRLVLRVVGLSPGLSAGDVAAILHVHPSTLTGVLYRLIARRLLMRAQDRVDRRRAVLHLTARGTRVNVDSGGTVEAAVARALDGASHRDRLAARRVLKRLAECLEGSNSVSPWTVRNRKAAARAGSRTKRLRDKSDPEDPT